MATFSVDLKFYAVMNRDGKWLRSTGFSGVGKSWVDDISKARIYGKIGPARARVTWWATNYPYYGVPTLVCILADKAEEMDEIDRVKKVAKRKEELKAKAEERRQKRRMEQAQRDLEKAQEKLERLKRT